MSIRAMEWVWEQTSISAPAKLVLLALADHADDEGVCWPGAKRIAVKCNMARTTALGHLRTLREAGLVKKEPRTSESGATSSNLYILPLPPLEEGGSVSRQRVSANRTRGVGRRAGGLSAHRAPFLNPHLEPPMNEGVAGKRPLSREEVLRIEATEYHAESGHGVEAG